MQSCIFSGEPLSPPAITTEYPVCGIFFFLEDQVQFIQLFPPGQPRLQGIPGGVYTGATQNVHQAGQIPLRLEVSPGEQVSQVIGEDLSHRHFCLAAQRFHLPPQVGPVRLQLLFSQPGGRRRRLSNIFIRCYIAITLMCQILQKLM